MSARRQTDAVRFAKTASVSVCYNATMRFNPLMTTLAALVVAALALGAAWGVLRPSGPALTGAAFAFDAITPNADGDRDVTRITYDLRRPATISIYLTNPEGQIFYFRREKPRDAGEYQLDFSGIVEPYVLGGDSFAGELGVRVLQNGEYAWVVEAVDANGPSGRFTGSLTIANADTTLPELLNLSVSPKLFTPNQDGLDDRVNITVYLSKDIAPNGLHVSLIGPTGAHIPISEKPSDRQPGERGLHAYDYDGGIDNGQKPPPDGEYAVRLEAEDRLGQKVAISDALTIQHGGLPRAEIVQGEVEWSSETLVLGQTVFFTLTVENYGTAPIRTSGPPPGTVYSSMNINANTLGEYDQSGAWRVGIDCDTCIKDYPWRWGLGTSENLSLIPDANGQAQYYLMPGQKALVSGGIVLDTLIASRNPQYFWAGLIHEDVGVDLVNNRVGQQLTKIVPTE